jgi:hypothetical protein
MYVFQQVEKPVSVGDFAVKHRITAGVPEGYEVAVYAGRRGVLALLAPASLFGDNAEDIRFFFADWDAIDRGAKPGPAVTDQGGNDLDAQIVRDLKAQTRDLYAAVD